MNDTDRDRIHPHTSGKPWRHFDEVRRAMEHLCASSAGTDAGDRPPDRTGARSAPATRLGDEGAPS
ncbi:hypothetical protein ACIQWR_21745 [Streptomyces sp. NPDC098789]|uniref:hypothetical protein n=1 Tax=Streptomyces sp. NPDC098789 TaxID=3366098 RepID=UPI00382459E7